MRKSLKVLAAITLSLLLMFGSTMAIYAASVAPTELSGNDPEMIGFMKLKVDPPSNGSHTQGSLTVNLTFQYSGNEAMSMDWTSNIPVEYVFVKGGPGGNRYHYPGGSTGDTNLVAPNNHGISHVSFYYKDGSITIIKQVLGDPDDDAIFTFEIDGPDGYTETKQITGDGQVVINGLGYGEYIITENPIPDNYDVDDEAQTVNLSESDKTETVTFVNTFTPPPLGTITINKTLSGDTPPVDSQFEFEIIIPGDPEVVYATVYITGADSETEIDVPMGEYIVREVNNPPLYTMNSSNNQEADVNALDMDPEVTFDNIYTAPKGSITISKTLSGATPPSDATFEFEIIIPGDPEVVYATVYITGADTETEIDVPIGDYIVREVNFPQLYTINSLNDQEADVNMQVMNPEVTFDNTYREPDPELGTITVNKTLSGTIPPVDGIFDFEIIIPGEVEIVYDTFTIVGAGTHVQYEVPIGDYIIREGNLPTNYSLNSSNNQEANVVEEDMDPEVTFDNTYTEPDPELGSITIEKDIIGDTPPSDVTFSFQLVGPLEDEGSSIRDFNIIGEGSNTFNDLVPGVYRIIELTPPTNYTIESGNNALISIEEVLTATATVTNRYTAPTPDPDPEPDPDPQPDPDPEPDPDPNPNRGTVRVFYVDTEDNLLDPIFEFTGPVGTNYGTAARTYEDLELVATPGNAFGSFIDGVIDVIYVYSPPEDEILVLEEEIPLGAPEIPEATPEVPDEEIVLDEPIPLAPLPQTGQLPAELFFGFGSLISLIGVAFGTFGARKGRKSR